MSTNPRIETFTAEQLARADALAPAEWALVPYTLDDCVSWALRPRSTLAAPTSMRRLLETYGPEFDREQVSMRPVSDGVSKDVTPRPTQDDVVWP